MRLATISLFSAAVIFLMNSSISMAQRPTIDSQEINTVLMHSTFRIAGLKKNELGKYTFGTAFIMAVPFKDDSSKGYIVLVTAAHVLDDIGADQATLFVRRRDIDGTYTEFPHNIEIQRAGKSLYVKHGTADVAAMYINLPNDVPIAGVTPDFLIDDKRIDEIELHPGDEAFVLGFPLSASGPGGFPILRTGHIASYPLTPMKSVKQILFDLFLYGGNSGGPVYFSYVSRLYKGSIHMGSVQGILGLVTQQANSAVPEFSDKSLNLGIVVPAPFIRETIEMLPSK